MILHISAQCRDSTEVKMILQQKCVKPTNDLTLPKFLDEVYPRIALALLWKQKEFVAHPNSQMVLNEQWTGKAYIEHNSVLLNLPNILFRLLTLPFLALINLFKPNSDDAPINKCRNSTASYLIFVALILTISVTDQKPSGKGPPIKPCLCKLYN